MGHAIRIMIMGAGGAAGCNLIECLRMSKLATSIIATDTCAARVQLPNADVRYVVPHSCEAQYVDEIRRLIRQERIDFAFAQPDSEVRRMSENDGYGVPTGVPPSQVIRIYQDKFFTYQALAKKGIPVPKTLRFESSFTQDSFDMLAATNGKVWVRHRNSAGSFAALRVSRFAQMAAWIDYWAVERRIERDLFVAAEYLPGDDYACQTVWWNGLLLGAISRRRLRYAGASLSPSGQTSSAELAESTDSKEPTITAIAAIEAIEAKPHGIYGVDMRCRADGQICVTEINAGRFYTTCNFHAATGHNLPHAILAAALHLDKVQMPPVRSGIRWIRAMDTKPRLLE